MSAVLALAGCGPHFTTADLAPGMTQTEVISKLGKPKSGTLTNGEKYLIFKVNDDAFGRSDNFYAVGFKDDKLTSIAPLPESMQEMGLIDRALMGARINQSQTIDLGNTTLTPNAYGPGIHMDQYGRPVQVIPSYKSPRSD